MNLSAHIVMVDDDLVIRKLVEKYLTKQGYRVSTADGGAAMRHILERESVDLVILDLSMPEEHGFGLLTEIRKSSDVGVIILTGSETEVDEVVGLELGADDYVAKSGDMRQLLARVRSVLRRTKSVADRRPKDDGPVLEFAGWRLDPTARQLLSPDGSEVALTTAEFDLLSALVTRANRVLNRDQLLDITQNRDWSPYDRSIDKLVSHLRQKIEVDSRHPKLIKSVRGVGYIFAAKVSRV